MRVRNQKTMDTGIWPLNLMKFSFFLQRPGILKRKLVIAYSTIWNRVHLIFISCWYLLQKYYREKSGFLLLYPTYSTTSQMHFSEVFSKCTFVKVRHGKRFCSWVSSGHKPVPSGEHLNPSQPACFFHH